MSYIVIYAGMPMQLPTNVAVPEEDATRFATEYFAWYAAGLAGFTFNLIRVVPAPQTSK